MSPKERPKDGIPQIQNVNKIRRKENSNYEEFELWKDPDCNRAFLQYVPSARDRAFHAMMLDTSCRSKELMNAKIKDLHFIDEGYNQRHAILYVVGKSGKRLKKMLSKSLPYVKEWLAPGNHPTPNNPEAYLLCGNGNRNRGGKLNRRSFTEAYRYYKEEFFPSLLKSDIISESDKVIIKEKMLTRPWKPYVFRYTSLTEKSAYMSEYELREHADWSPTSQMPRKYLRFRGDESIKALQKAYGITAISSSGKEHNIGNELEGALAPTLICYNCKEPNKAGSRICSNPNCKMILSFEVQAEMMNETENTKKELEEMKAKMTRRTGLFLSLGQQRLAC